MATSATAPLHTTPPSCPELWQTLPQHCCLAVRPPFAPEDGGATGCQQPENRTQRHQQQEKRQVMHKEQQHHSTWSRPVWRDGDAHCPEVHAGHQATSPVATGLQTALEAACTTQPSLLGRSSDLGSTDKDSATAEAAPGHGLEPGRDALFLELAALPHPPIASSPRNQSLPQTPSLSRLHSRSFPTSRPSRFQTLGGGSLSHAMSTRASPAPEHFTASPTLSPCASPSWRRSPQKPSDRSGSRSRLSDDAARALESMISLYERSKVERQQGLTIGCPGSVPMSAADGPAPRRHSLDGAGWSHKGPQRTKLPVHMSHGVTIEALRRKGESLDSAVAVPQGMEVGLGPPEQAQLCVLQPSGESPRREGLFTRSSFRAAEFCEGPQRRESPARRVKFAGNVQVLTYNPHK